MPGSPHEARTQRQWAPPSPVAYSAYGLDPAAPSLELKRTQAALGRAPQLRPPSVERHTLVPLATQPSLAEVKQTDCGDAGAASADQVRPPSRVCTSLVAWIDSPESPLAPPAMPQPSLRLEKWTRRSGPTLG